MSDRVVFGRESSSNGRRRLNGSSRRGDSATFVTITASGFAATDEEKVAQAIDNMGGFSYLLAGCKAFLEHGVTLNLVADHNPDAHVK